MGELGLLLRARLAGLEVWGGDDRLYIEGPRNQETLAQELLAHKVEVLAELQAEQAGPWPTTTWGPLLAEHFAVRTLDDLENVPIVPDGFNTTALREGRKP